MPLTSALRDRATQVTGVIDGAGKFDSLYGLELTEQSPQRMAARVTVTDRIRQPFGMVHGGVYAAIAEALASVGTRLGVSADGSSAVGLANHTNFIRPISAGTIHAEARPRHRGRTTWVWDVDMSDDNGRLCAVSRMTIAVRRPASAGAEPEGHRLPPGHP